jgi:hypothetical protein
MCRESRPEYDVKTFLSGLLFPFGTSVFAFVEVGEASARNTGSDFSIWSNQVSHSDKAICPFLFHF